MNAPLTPGAIRMIVDHLVLQERQAADDLRAAELRHKAARAATAEARQHFGVPA